MGCATSAADKPGNAWTTQLQRYLALARATGVRIDAHQAAGDIEFIQGLRSWAADQVATAMPQISDKVAVLSRGVGAVLPGAGYLSVAAGGLHEVLFCSGVPLRYCTGASGGGCSGFLMLAHPDATVLLMA